MKNNNDFIPPSNDYFTKNNIPKSYPDIIEQVDKVINKYKNQIEQLKPKNIPYDKNYYYQYNFTSEKKSNTSNYPIKIKNDSEKYINNISTNINKKNYNYEEVKEEINDSFKPNNNINTNNYNYKYNFKYNLNENKNNNNIELPNYNKDNSNLKLYNEFSYEMENDNIKLGSALTTEKAKVVQLLNLLKEKENEISKLKQQLDNFEVKINEIENKYQNIINTLEQQQSLKINDIFNNISEEKNRLKTDFNEIKRNSEVQLEQFNNELNSNKKIIKLFFDLFNKNLDLFNKTEIFRGPKITENNFTEENAFLAADTLDRLINKLVQDNKDLFNELFRLKGEIDNNNIIMGQNNNFIQQENNSLKEMVNNLTHENNFLKNKSYTNLKHSESRNNYELSQYSKTQGNIREKSSSKHRHVVHSICRHCTPDCFRRTKNNFRDNSPFENLKIKINDLENQLRNQTYS